MANDWQVAALRGSAALAMLSVLGLSSGPAAAQAVSTQAVSGPVPAATPAAAVTTNGVGSAFELTFWQSLVGSDDPASYDAYLAKYPDGTFSGLARAKIAVLQRALAAQSAAVSSAATPAPLPAPVPAVLNAPQAAPMLAPTPVVVTAAAPTPSVPAAIAAAPAVTAPAAAVLASAAPAPVPATAVAPVAPSAEMIPASAAVAEASSPLTRLLAQLRGSPQASTAPAAALATAAPPAHAAASPAGVPASAAPAPVAALSPVAAPVQTYASARPVMLPVPEVALPAFFCSNDARNTFHNAAYRPAVDAATRNNEASVGYLRQLQQTYDRGQLGRDTAVLNAIAAEARAYQAEAARAYSAQAALVRQFDALMAVPLRTCMASAQ